jgi:hypothetical protein
MTLENLSGFFNKEHVGANGCKVLGILCRPSSRASDYPLFLQKRHRRLPKLASQLVLCGIVIPTNRTYIRNEVLHDVTFPLGEQGFARRKIHTPNLCCILYVGCVLEHPSVPSFRPLPHEKVFLDRLALLPHKLRPVGCQGNSERLPELRLVKLHVSEHIVECNRIFRVHECFEGVLETCLQKARLGLCLVDERPFSFRARVSGTLLALEREVLYTSACAPTDADDGIGSDANIDKVCEELIKGMVGITNDENCLRRVVM